MDWLFKVLIAFLVWCIDLSAINAQDAIPASGGNASGAGGATSYSVGQVAYAHFQGQEGQVSLGVQQVYLKIMVATEVPQPDISVELYPNPVQNDLQLNLNRKSFAEDIPVCTYHLHDIYGKELLSGKTNSTVTNISMEGLTEGIYFLVLTRHAKSIKTFKVIKTK
jgi:hypothetical protein